VAGGILASPWFLAMEAASPGYLHYYFIQRHFMGYVSEGQMHGMVPWHFYLAPVLGGAMPWLFYATAGVLQTWHDDWRARQSRATMLAALESSEGLARSWANLTVGSLAASNLISLLTSHDLTVAGAAAQGRDADYEAALVTLATAVGMLDEATEARDRLANTTDVVTLDEWIRRNRHYDEALIALYSALRDSGGLVNDAVREAYREEGEARANLPPDTRGLVVIVADIGRGGLNQAVIAIEQARGRLNLIIEALAPAETSLAPAGSGGA